MKSTPDQLESPLPRDIVARIIIRIGPSALPFLENILHSGTYIQKLEAIDAISHITFNSNDFRSASTLLNSLKEHSNDEFVVWKIIRAFQAFRSTLIISQLTDIINTNKNTILIKEAKRSLRQIERCSVHQKQL